MLERIPSWARWPLAYLATVALCFAVGWPTPLGFGNAMFLAGVVALAWSLTYVRLGGPKALVGRTPKGRPIFEADEEKRRHELRRGFSLFAFAMALWLPLAIRAYAF